MKMNEFALVSDKVFVSTCISVVVTISPDRAG
jgi:hypothetical protein